MRYIPKTIQVQPGLLGALAMQTLVTDRVHTSRQRLAIGLPVGGPFKPGAKPPLPHHYEPTPHALAYEHNVRTYLELLSKEIHSNNPYNDHTAFAHAPILAGGWMEVPTQWQVAPGRNRTDNNCLVNRFERIFAACSGFNQRFPIVLDRQGRVLDGHCRLEALKTMNADKPTGYSAYRVYFLQLDF